MNSGQFKLRYHTDPAAFDGETADSRWAIGLMAADGNVRLPSAQIRFGQSLANADLMRKLKKHINHNGQPYFVKNTKSYMLSWTSMAHANALSEFGVVPAKSLIFSLPSIDRISLDFMRGYIDGDGCVGFYDNGSGRKYLHLSWVGNPLFIRQCQEWLPTPGRRRGIGNVDELRFSGTKAEALCRLIYPEGLPFISRKHQKFLDATGAGHDPSAN